MKNKILTTLAVLAALGLIAGGALAAPSRPTTAFASTSTQITTAQNNLDNCRLLAGNSVGSQRDRANACVLDQTRILALLSPPTTRPPTTSPSASHSPTTSPTGSSSTTPTPPPTTTPPPTSLPPTGWPNASNTGVPAGTTLIHTSGRTITVAGTEVNGEDIDGCLTIKADNVTVRNSRIRCTGEPIAARVRTGVLIQDVEADCMNNPGSGMVGNFTAYRVNIHGCENGMSIDGRNIVKDSWIHDLFERLVPVGHTDGIQVFVGAEGPMLIQHNWIENLTPDATSAIIASDHFDLLAITDNRLIATAYFVLRCPTSGSTNTIMNNVISGSILKPPVQWIYCSDEANVSGNVDGNGQPLAP